MRLLLDTHIWVWSALQSDRLTPHVAGELENPANELWLSPLSTWEFILLVEKGRIVLELDPTAWIQRVLRTLPLKEAPLTHEVALRSRAVRLPHRDPVDQLLVATALAQELTLVTADRRILENQPCPLVANQ
ncbi:MAG: type II toxin-antitoxin system VapC family toxin [Gemmatimonadetes bacterium]|nr:type II toxin-antitoxin system VapC family toxin [Gemmatimonadota bacterium]